MKYLAIVGIFFLIAVADATFLNGAISNVIHMAANNTGMFTPFW